MEVVAEAIEAFQKGEDFCQELLDSFQDAYAKGSKWYKKKMAKHFLELVLDVLSSGRSSSSSNSCSSSIDEGGKVTLPAF